DIYPFSYHLDYFHREIEPHLDGRRVRWVRSPNFATKLRLLQDARALLVPSTAAETSPLVAMEAAACGTPTIASPSGALPEIVEHGENGLIVADVDEMVEAVRASNVIAPQRCRAAAEARFSARRM